MRIKNVDLNCCILLWDVNRHKVVDYNILANPMKVEIATEVKKGKLHDKKSLKRYLKTEFMYRYFSRAEYEFYISDLPGNYFEKIDAWRQIEPNLNNIVEYINSQMDLKFK